jgi:hypothetical protein
MAQKKFRRHDKKKLDAFDKSVAAIDARDLLAANTNYKGVKISTHVEVISTLDSALVAAWALVKARIVACRAMVN